MSKRRIGIFGGSFNPVHNGHIHICQAFLDSNLIDELWIIPVFDPPHKPSEQLVSFSHRLEMTKLAFRNIPNIIVIDIEKELAKPNYTLKTIKYLKATYPDLDFLLCIGGDSLEYFNTWYEYESLLELVELLVVKRKDVSYNSVETKILDRSNFILSEITPESSSEIRDEIASTGSTIQVPTEVFSYIQLNHLYRSTSY